MDKPDKVNHLPCWVASHALIYQSNLPLKRVGFLPAIPHSVTDYTTVYTTMRNFLSVGKHLPQPVLPIISDEGVFQIVQYIVLSNPGDFDDLYPIMGMFHMTKVVLHCADRYITGSGMDDAMIVYGIFGIKTLDEVLEGKHYICAFHGMLIVSEVIESLIWRVLWQFTDEIDVLACVTDLV